MYRNTVLHKCLLKKDDLVIDIREQKQKQKIPTPHPNPEANTHTLAKYEISDTSTTISTLHLGRSFFLVVASLEMKIPDLGFDMPVFDGFCTHAVGCALQKKRMCGRTRYQA